MELDQLRAFLQVADASSISRAAVVLNTSQPALSRQIQALEAELGARLFYRNGRGVVVTDAGRALYVAVKPMLTQLNDVTASLREQSGDPTGTVVLGMPSSIMGTIGASLARRFMAGYPKASLHLYEGSSGLLLERLDAGLIGAAVLYETRRGSNTLVTPILHEQLFLVDAYDPAASEGEIRSTRDFHRRTLFLPGHQSGLRRAVDMAFSRLGLVGEIAMDMHSVTVIKQLVEQGVGSTILPFGTVHREVRARSLLARPIPMEMMSATLVTATATGQPMTRATHGVIQLLEAQVREGLEAGILRGRLPGSGVPGVA